MKSNGCSCVEQISLMGQLAIHHPHYTRKSVEMPAVVQRFSELCENCRVSSHQILTGRADGSETALKMMNHHAGQ